MALNYGESEMRYVVYQLHDDDERVEVGRFPRMLQAIRYAQGRVEADGWERGYRVVRQTEEPVSPIYTPRKSARRTTAERE